MNPEKLAEQIRLGRRAAELIDDPVIAEIDRQLMQEAENDLNVCDVTDHRQTMAAVIQWRLSSQLNGKMRAIAKRLDSAVDEMERQSK